MPTSGAIALVKWTVFDASVCFFADFSTGVAGSYVVAAVVIVVDADASDFTLTLFGLLALQPRAAECDTSEYSPEPK